jgi:hypothetical protein
LSSLTHLYTGLKNLVRLFREARGYKDLELKSNEKSFTLPLMTYPNFVKWVMEHKAPMMYSLHILGKNADSTKTIRADFLLTELPFEQKDMGVKQVRETLDRIHKAHVKDKIGIATSYVGSNMIYLPREMEVTLIYDLSLTPDASKYLMEFKKQHRRMTVVELSLNAHLRSYIMDHRYMPRKLRRLNKIETKKHTPKGDIRCNELAEDTVEVLLIGGVPGDMIESTLALKSGVNLVQYWKIIPSIKKK